MTVEVTEADRRAASAMLRAYLPDDSADQAVRLMVAQQVDDGMCDQSIRVQAFAAHRNAAESAVREACAKVAERWYCEVFATEHENRCFTDIAAIIRAGSTGDKG